MRRRSVLGGLAIGAASVGGVAKATPRRPATTPVLNTLAMPVTPAENRQYSYTNKVSGYFHGRTHSDTNPDWFNGWNIATKRIFHDYAVSLDGVVLSRASANVTVSPHKIVRRFDGATETLSLLDGLAVLVLDISDVRGDTIGMALKGDLTDAGTLGPEGVWFLPKEAAGTHLLVAAMSPQTVTLDPVRGVIAPKSAGGFFLIHAQTKPEATRLLARVRRNWRALLAARAGRMEALVSGNHALDAGDPDRTKALLWMRLTGDQLVMKQLGTGIYAGLPWFNDYWGRDTFISITGILFINGQFKEAAEVFESFAALQDTDPNSKTYGRVPNRARPDGIEYNSADGTPRFIITLADLVQRSGDVALAKRLWPAVKRAVEGVLKNNVDELGLITHEDADTWMDAKEKGVRAWSPRGNRAIDVQALWLGGFKAALEIGVNVGVSGSSDIEDLLTRSLAPPRKALNGDQLFLVKCERAFQRLDDAFATHFIDPATNRLVDHLKPDGTKEIKLRPNAFFAIGWIEPKIGKLAENPEALRLQKLTWARELWEGLVYPWGVATLSQDDPDFHPYHEHWHYYHKDAAYHNGTVWPWLNGVAMKMLVSCGQVSQPWRLFENMNRQALREGAVGSLAECADALPAPTETWTRRTGTFLQAWSNAEHLRIWQECFLGLSVQQSPNIITIEPKLPKSILNVAMSMPIGMGVLHGKWHNGTSDKWSFTLFGVDASFYFTTEMGSEAYVVWQLKAGQRIDIVKIGNDLSGRVFEADGRSQLTDPSKFVTVTSNEPIGVQKETWIERQERSVTDARDSIFANLDFCKPRLNPNLKSLSVYHDPPLTY
jgi:glycogen debranching enzyme